MPLPTSGAISLNQIHVEAGGISGTQASINDSDIRGLISKSSGVTMSFNEWYGAGGTTLSSSNGNTFFILNSDNSISETVTATGLNTSGSYNLFTPSPTVTSGSLLCSFNSSFHAMTHPGGGTWTVTVNLNRTGTTTGTGTSTFEVKAGFTSLSPALTRTVSVVQSS